jgi:site-specific recombinase XerD
MTAGFTAYRQKKGYSEKSLKVQDCHINRFNSWCTLQGIDPETITYQETLQFIDSERARGILNQSIIREINSIRIYFDYLVHSGKVQQNVIRRIRIRRRQNRILQSTFSQQQLEKIYLAYVALPEWEHRTKTSMRLHQRNVFILGLLVYQGITSGEIAKLERSHVKLKEGKIYIPATRKSNGRWLKLQAAQVMAMQAYIEDYLPQSDQQENPWLFSGKKHSDMVASIIKQVKRIHPELTDARQIRSSVIMNWLKTNNIRQVQYMAGHKSIRSTEQYRSQDLSNLTRQLELFHPLK